MSTSGAAQTMKDGKFWNTPLKTFTIDLQAAVRNNVLQRYVNLQFQSMILARSRFANCVTSQKNNKTTPCTTAFIVIES
jgi:hypothetical protein